jgi:hypothetical protein
METKVLTQDELTQLRNLKEQQQNILMYFFNHPFELLKVLKNQNINILIVCR